MASRLIGLFVSGTSDVVRNKPDVPEPQLKSLAQSSLPSTTYGTRVHAIQIEHLQRAPG